MDVEIIELPELRVAAVSHKGPYNQIGTAFARLGQIAGAAGLFGPSAGIIRERLRGALVSAGQVAAIP
jgi:DNA gyrase inhibitor GyrI